jgi:enamine deaminase RidA (YjgF/YER057c/UK114 family)
MTTTSYDIPGLPPIADGLFAHVASAEGRLLLISGQTGVDSSGAVAEGLAAQVEHALLNVARAVEAAGGDVSHLVRLRFYVVGWDPSKIEEFMVGGGAAVAQLPGLPRTAVTVIGVQALFTPDLLVEVEAEAVVPMA